MSPDPIMQRSVVAEVGFEDRARMTRLIEEVSGRLGEIARITARDRSEAPILPLSAARIIVDELEDGLEYAIQLKAEEGACGRSATVQVRARQGLTSADDDSDDRSDLRMAEDRSRMLRLMEEIMGRADEMASVVSRVQPSLGRLTPVRSIRLSVVKEGPQAGRVDVQLEPILVVGDGVGCYSDPPGICCECPCP